MTAQIPDTVIYEDQEYALIGVKGENLPTPATFGIVVSGMWSTDCYRGYVATYLCNDEGLFLEHLHMGRVEDWTPINGVEAETVYREGYRYSPKHKEGKPSRWEDGKIYRNLRAPSYFSGGVLIARDFIPELYVHMGHGKPYQYQQVHELLFHEGTFTKHIDHSDKTKEVRDKIIADLENRKTRMQQLRDAGLSEKEAREYLHEESTMTGQLDHIMKGIEWRFSLDYGHWF